MNTFIDGDYVVTEYDSGAVVRELRFAPAPEAAPRTLTHLQFRRLFTPAEQESCDELEVTFEANAALSAAQKRGLRTGYKNFYAASEVNLDDPAIPPMLGLYEALGLIDAGRAAEILS